MNLNEFAKCIALKEGKKVNLPIAQIKEVMKLVLTKLAEYEPEEIEKVLRRYRRI